MSTPDHNGRGRRRRRAVIDDLATHEHASVTIEQLAAYWSVGVSTVRKWVRTGALPAFQVGPRQLRVKRRDAIRFERSIR